MSGLEYSFINETKPIEKVKNDVHQINNSINKLKTDIISIKADISIIKDYIKEQGKEKEISKGWIW